MAEIDEILEKASKEIYSQTTINELNNIKSFYLGAKSELKAKFNSLPSIIEKQERKVYAIKLNDAKQFITNLIKKRHQKIQDRKISNCLKDENIDISLEGRGQEVGSIHPLNQITVKIINFFRASGFKISQGEQIEDDYHNFEALNIPVSHPARDAQDTFYIDDDYILRTHTSPAQIRYMQQNLPPCKIISFGPVYRRDFDATHTPMFHQLEGFVVDKFVNLAYLKATLIDFIEYFFAKKLELRFRASYFPFTEPSIELDIACKFCNSKGCKVCNYLGWLEILGAGLIHPNVFKSVEIDSEVWSGFAFGLGIDRLTMLYYEIDDLRLLFTNDLEFLRQF